MKYDIIISLVKFKFPDGIELFEPPDQPGHTIFSQYNTDGELINRYLVYLIALQNGAHYFHAIEFDVSISEESLNVILQKEVEKFQEELSKVGEK